MAHPGPRDDAVIRYEGRFDRSLFERTNFFVEPRFGVDWRNGMARPWVDNTSLSNSFADFGLSGTATWAGELVGFTPRQEAVLGNAAMEIDIAALKGRAAFTALEHWNAGAAPGAVGTGTTWGDGDLHYAIAAGQIGGYGIRSAGGDAGYVSGRFVGSRHRAAIGILEHPDLTGAFGAVRK